MTFTRFRPNAPQERLLSIGLKWVFPFYFCRSCFSVDLKCRQSWCHRQGWLLRDLRVLCYDQPTGLQAMSLLATQPGDLVSDWSVLPFLILCSWRDWNSLSFRVDIRYWESWCKLTYGFKVESGAKVSFNVHCQVAVVVHQEEKFSRALNSSVITCISSALVRIMY